MKIQCAVKLMILFVVCFVAFAGSTWAGEISIKGNGEFNNNAKLIIDGEFAEQGSAWDNEKCVWWNGTSPYFIIDLGEIYEVHDFLLQVDNNDDYKIDYSADGTTFTPLVTVKAVYGEIEYGMDTVSSAPGNTDFIEGMAFEPVNARFIKIYAAEGDDSYSISEIQFTMNPVPKKWGRPACLPFSLKFHNKSRLNPESPRNTRKTRKLFGVWSFEFLTGCPRHVAGGVRVSSFEFRIWGFVLS